MGQSEVLKHIHTLKGDVFLSASQIAKELNANVKSVSRCLKCLRQSNFIAYKKINAPSRNSGGYMVYGKRG